MNVQKILEKAFVLQEQKAHFYFSIYRKLFFRRILYALYI